MKLNIYFIFLVALFFGGCGISTKIAIPKTEFPLEYNNLDTKNKDVKIKEEWWKDFQDEKLSLIIDEALKNNLDFQTAVANISLSRATLTSTTADRYPKVKLQGSSNNIKTSASTTNSNTSNKYNNYSLSTVLSYEIDLWGKYQNAQKSSKATLLASYAAKDTVKLSLIANIIDNYFNLISLNQQLSIINKMIFLKKEQIKKYKIQYNAGFISKINILQEEASLININLNKDSLEQSIILQKSSLAILIGKSPKEIEQFCKEIFKDKLPQDINIPKNLPSELLNNRPDIKQAEENLKATNYNISVAKAMYFPKISLSALIGFESLNFSNLFQSDSIKNNIGSSLSSPLLNLGKISSNVDTAISNRELAEISYKKIVQKAFKEVYDVLNKRKSILQKIENQKLYTQTLQETYEIIKNQYNQGYVDYFVLLNSERNYLSSQTNLVQLNQSLLSTTVTLYKALGGGWDRKYLNDIEEH